MNKLPLVAKRPDHAEVERPGGVTFGRRAVLRTGFVGLAMGGLPVAGFDTDGGRVFETCGERGFGGETGLGKPPIAPANDRGGLRFFIREKLRKECGSCSQERTPNNARRHGSAVVRTTDKNLSCRVFGSADVRSVWR